MISNLPLNLADIATIMNGSYPPSSFSALLPCYLDLSAHFTIGKGPFPPSTLPISKTFSTLSCPYGAPPHSQHLPQHQKPSDSLLYTVSIGGLTKSNHTSTWTAPHTTPLSPTIHECFCTNSAFQPPPPWPSGCGRPCN